jgi:hypothetical protein
MFQPQAFLHYGKPPLNRLSPGPGSFIKSALYFTIDAPLFKL